MKNSSCRFQGISTGLLCGALLLSGSLSSVSQAVAAETLIASQTSSSAEAKPTPLGNPVPNSEGVTTTSQEPFAILSPTAGGVVDRPAISVTLQYPQAESVELRVNGVAVDRTQIGRTETNSTTQRITETWYGVVLQEGNNVLTLHRTGTDSALATTTVQLSGIPAQLRVKTLENNIPADGRSTTTVQGELLDRFGNRSNWNTLVTLESSAGEFVGKDAKPDVPGFQVEATQGTFSTKLRSGIKAESVRVRASSNELEAYYQFQFVTQLRPEPLITGVASFRFGARGTNFFDRYQDFLPLDRNNDYVLDAQGAGFGTASVGDWLITGAFNSERPLNQDGEGNNRLFGETQFSEQQYPVYGDSSTNTRVAPSQDNFYLKAERTSPIKHAGSDYFMWGDYDTAEFSTAAQEFTATNRSLHGFKGNYNIGNLQLTALYANNVQGFQRDTIAPDGTSGFYFLSRRNVIDGSETVAFELEELNRPGTVVEATALQRGIDYTIDYDRGTLLFSEPVLRIVTTPDGRILVRRIVVTYQYEAQEANTSIYAGRARYHFSREPGQEKWLGGTYWRENQGSRDFELYGADLQVKLGEKVTLKAEYAHSQNDADALTDTVSGNAFRIEAIAKPIDTFNLRAFYRTAEPGFTNNATISFVPGQTRYGLEATGQVTKTTRLRFQFDHEDNFGIAPQPLSLLDQLLNPGVNPTPGQKQDNSLTTVLAGVEQRMGKATLGVNYIHRDRIDRAPVEDIKNVSDQLEATFSMPLRDNLKLRALTAINLNGDDPIYTNRAQVGLDWQINPMITMGLNQTYLWGGQYGDRAITSLDTVAKHNLTKDTVINGRFSILGGIDGMTGQGAAGITHHWQIVPGLGLDVGYEYVMGQFFGKTAAGTQFTQPYAVGSGASALGLESGHNFSIGLDYTSNPDLKASLRYQFRTSASGENSVLTGDVMGKITPYLTGLVRYEQGGAANQLLGLLGDTINLKVGLAYRDPSNDKFNALLRYEFRENPATTPDTILLGTGTGSTDHTLSVEGIYAPNWQWELYGKLGYRHSTTHLADDFTSSSSLLLGQLRATHRFNYRWDVMGEARILQSLSSGSTELGATAEVGYYLTPNLRLGVGYAFGSVSGPDFDNARSASGPYVGFTIKFDELFKGFRFYKKNAPPPVDTVKKAENSADPSGSKTTPMATH
jgi:hypothetical protein